MYAQGISPGWLKVTLLMFSVGPSQTFTPPLPCRNSSHSCLAQQMTHLTAFQLGCLLPQSASPRVSLCPLLKP